VGCQSSRDQVARDLSGIITVIPLMFFRKTFLSKRRTPRSTAKSGLKRFADGNRYASKSALLGEQP
jgi:hypothetical protein